MIRVYRTIIAVCVGLLASVFLYFHFSVESAPRLANYYLRWEIRSSDVTELAKWDLLILDMETQATSRALIEKIRALNPEIKILAYITSQEIRRDARGGSSVMRRKLAGGLAEEWYLTDVDGHRYSFWPGTDMLNPTSQCPQVNGKSWNDYLANFVAREILSTGLWDGVFYDNTWGGLTWFSGKEVDINRDGQSEGASVDAAWREGMRQLFNTTRRLAGNQYILVGNAITREYGESLNGIMIENMQNNRWREVMNAYRAQSQSGAKPRVIIVNGNTSNTGDNINYRLLRFTLASTLLGNGFFSYDYGDRDHGQVWWYDEYNINLGEPTGEAYAVSGATPFNEDVWRRDYAHGLTIVNATGEAQTVDLGAEYEKIVGTQDPTVNDGQVTDKVNLSGKDGLLLLKTARTIDEVVFENGAFLRFVDARGNRVRNGFFVFEEGFAGEARIWRGDLNGETGLEKISTEDGKMDIFNSRGEYWYNDYPFGVEYLGGINVAVGELNNEGKINLVVAPASGGTVNLYNYYGALLQQGFYPLGRKYRGSFSPAIGQVQVGPGNILLGVGKGRAAEVLIYGNNLTKLIRRFYPYEKSFTGGVKVAAGDVNGDGLDEIITVPMSGRRSLVRVFNGLGKKLSEFYLSTALGGQNISLATADVNYDGVEEIVVMSK